MPLVDRRTDSVVLRIVYDGSPESGKTTNLRVLCDRLSLGRRGELHSPGGGERTQFFDWLDVTGGYVAGKRLRCQLVTVPGQIELARRRRHLLDSADAVVFVVDARPEAIEAARGSLALLERLRASRHPLPLLVQANKQDVAGALAVDRIAGALALDPSVPIVAAQACHGIGVLETFMLAVRLAVDRIRVAMARGEIAEGDSGSVDGLLAELRLADGFEAVAAAAASAGVTEAVPVAAAEPVADDGPVVPGGSVATGLVWPPQSGRFALRSLEDERRLGATLEPAGDDGFRCGSWSLYARGPFPSADEVRARLLEAVSRQPAIGALVPASRTLAVAGERLWYVVERTRSLADAARDGEPDLDARIAAARELIARLAPAAAGAGLALVFDAALVSDDGQQYLGPAWSGAPVAPEDAARALAASLAALRPPLEGDVLEVAEAPAIAGSDDDLVPLDPRPDGDWQLPTMSIPAGMVWPQVRGRGALSSLVPPGQPAVGPPRAWAPRGAIEIECGDWVAHTSETWRFADLDDGRAVLLELVRWQTRLGVLTPPGRTLALAPSHDGARLWMLTPEGLATCWDRLLAALVSDDAARLRAERERAQAALDAVRAGLTRAGLTSELALDLITLDPEPRLLAPPPALAQPGADARLAAQLARVAC